MASRDVLPFDCAGRATTGEQYGSIAAMWTAELDQAAPGEGDSKCARTAGSGKGDASWYEKSASYWENQKASVQGMLGGLGELDTRDVLASRRFLASLLRDEEAPLTRAVVLDVGAGIGRVTRNLLLPLFGTVDMLEQNVGYLQESCRFVELQGSVGNVGKRIACGMQDFRADGVTGADGVESGSLKARYRVVWVQWCIAYMTDDHLVRFLEECTKCLAPGGYLCIKDNVAGSGFVLDKEDSSVMRSLRYLKHLIHRAGLKVVKETKQLDFPSNIFPVRTLAMQPDPKLAERLNASVSMPEDSTDLR